MNNQNEVQQKSESIEHGAGTPREPAGGTPALQEEERPCKKKDVRLLVLGDSIATMPGQPLTGFGRVLMNLLSRFQVTTDLWAIGFTGHGYKPLAEAYPNITLIPAGNQRWNSGEALGMFLNRLRHGNYTHVLILMDPDAVSEPAFLAKFSEILKATKTKFILYYPVDAPLQDPCGIIRLADVAVTFTEYGARETGRKISRTLHVLPHGIDDHFTPVTPEEHEAARAALRKEDGSPFVKPGDLLILNVNKNEWRKDPLRTLEIVKGLRDNGVPAKLILRMDPMSWAGGVHLERAAEQLGLKFDEDWAALRPVPEQHLRNLYGAADLYTTTTTGEGWGLGVTEALACGTPVAVPPHTSLGEIGMRVNFGDGKSQYSSLPVKFLDLEDGFICGSDNRLRQRVALVEAVDSLTRWHESNSRGRVVLSPSIRQWLNWDRIAGEFLRLMGVDKV
jgi:glycosyltransferase involved in cell wall biosynthesis